MATAGAHDVVCNLVQVGTRELEQEGDGLDPNYRGLIVSGDMIMVIDWKADNVLLHRLRDGKLLATTHKLESLPRGVCLTNDMEICVILKDSQLVIMSIQCTGDTGLITRIRTLSVNTGFNICHGIVKFMDKVVVCGWKQDTICWCIASLNDGKVDTIHQICKGSLWSESHLATKDNMVYIACRAGDDLPGTGVFAYDIQNPCEQKFIYKHQDLMKPTGITMDARGFIFVCNADMPFCIYILTDKCELVTIYRKEMPPSFQPGRHRKGTPPSSRLCDIFWDQNHERMYVTCFRSNVITEFTPKYSDQDVYDIPALEQPKTQKKGTDYSIK